MTTIRKFMTVLVLALTLVVVTAMAAGAATTDPNYTTGEETYPPNPGNPNGDTAGWGAPPEAPFLQDGQICIDPPSVVWMTLHVVTDGTETDSLVFPYIHTQPGAACTGYVPPACPVEEIEIYGTWSIGTGRSPSLFIDNDCPDPLGEAVVSGTCESGNLVTLTNTGDAAWTVDSEGPFDGQTIEPGADSTADVGREAGSLTVNFSAGPKSGEASIEWTDQAICPVPPPAEVVPPAQATATPVAFVTPPAAKPPLPVTGPAKTAAEVLLASLLIGGGLLMTRASRAKRGLNV